MRVLALDPGRRRVGIAISDPLGTVARPIATMVRGSRDEDFDTILKLVGEYDVGMVVVGLPLTAEGRRGSQARTVARFADALAERLPVDVVLWDERYSTVTAQTIMMDNRGSSQSPRDRRRDLDAVAAAVILQSYLDETARSRAVAADGATPADDGGAGSANRSGG